MDPNNIREIMDPNILTQKRVNRNGGNYQNGKALDLDMRKEIIERFQNGEKVTAIAASLKVTHGVVSKITRHFQKTGSMLPKTRTTRKPAAVKKKTTEFTVDGFLGESSPEVKRERHLFKKEQVATMEEYFVINPYPEVNMKKEIMEKTGLSDREITTWFNNRRCRIRKQLVDTSSSSISSASSTSLHNDSSTTSTSSSTAEESPLSAVPNFLTFNPFLQTPRTSRSSRVSRPNPYLQSNPPLPPPPMPMTLPYSLEQFQFFSNILQQASLYNLMQQALQRPTQP